jgi:formylglycine-generating enzyme required for sulfatase activity/Leucine-rich repeat (LRR) protein
MSAAAADDRAYRSPHRVPASGWREGNHHAERDAYGGRTEGSKSNFRNPKLIALAAATSLLLAGILIVIKNQKGEIIARIKSDRPVEVDLPEGSTATISSTDEDLNPKSKIENPKSWHGWPADAPAPAIAPFDATQAKKHQQEWADYLKLPLSRRNTIGMKFVLIPPGEFLMGSTPDEIAAAIIDAGDNEGWKEEIRSEAPQHKVILTQPFYMAVDEVTQKEYQAVLGSNPSAFPKPDHPVDTVSYADAAEFCAKLSKQEDLKPFYFRADETVTPIKGNGYRLPTEAEWEFACRAGTVTKFFNGNELPAGWWGGNSGGRTHEVEDLAGNPFGLFDLHGNVSEWTDDSWDPKFYERFVEQPAINPIVPYNIGSRRIMRGGDWGDHEAHCRSANRQAYDPSFGSDHYIGFRVVLVVDALPGMSLAEKASIAPGNSLPAEPTSTAPPPADPNAELFKWVNEVGGQQEFLVDGNPIAVNLPNAIRLVLPDGPINSNVYTFWKISLDGCTRVAYADLKRFRSVSKPLSLRLARTNVSDDGLVALQSLPNLVALILTDTHITRAGLENLGVLPNLVTIFLSGTSLSDADLALLSQFPSLRTVVIGGSHLTARGIDALSTLSKLEHLEVHGDVDPADIERLGLLTDLMYFEVIGKFSDTCLERLKDLPKLKTLGLVDAGITDQGMANLPIAAPQLGYLTVRNSPISDAGLKHLSHLNMQFLSLSGTNVTATGVAELQTELPKCRIEWSPTLPRPTGDPNRDAAEWVLAMGGEVDVVPRDGQEIVGIKQPSDLPAPPYRLVAVLLRGPFIRDDDLGRLSNVASLHMVRVANAKITGAALEYLRGLANLRSVDFNSSPVGDTGIALLKELPKLDSLALANAGVTNAGLEHVGALKRLSNLRLDYNKEITDDGLAHLLGLHVLRHLNLAGTAIGDAGVERLRELAQLTELSVGATRITDDGLTSLATLKRLKRLEIYDNVITDVGMPEIAKLTNLEGLVMTHTRVGDDGVEKLKALTKLRELYLEGTELTDDGLKHLHALANLKHLGVRKTQVTTAGIAELKAALPGCEVIQDQAPAGAK